MDDFEVAGPSSNRDVENYDENDWYDEEVEEGYDELEEGDVEGDVEGSLSGEQAEGPEQVPKQPRADGEEDDEELADILLSSNTMEGKALVLNSYDRTRARRQVHDDDVMSEVNVRSMFTELCCPICLDLLSDTMTTKECLHRFCSECITMALLRGNKECPTCRKKLVSKRSLRRDPKYDDLISKIFPDRKDFEKMQEAVSKKKKRSPKKTRARMMAEMNERIRIKQELRRQMELESDDAEEIEEDDYDSEEDEVALIETVSSSDSDKTPPAILTVEELEALRIEEGDSSSHSKQDKGEKKLTQNDKRPEESTSAVSNLGFTEKMLEEKLLAKGIESTVADVEEADVVIEEQTLSESSQEQDADKEQELSAQSSDVADSEGYEDEEDDTEREYDDEDYGEEDENDSQNVFAPLDDIMEPYLENTPKDTEFNIEYGHVYVSENSEDDGSSESDTGAEDSEGEVVVIGEKEGDDEIEELERESEEDEEEEESGSEDEEEVKEVTEPTEDRECSPSASSSTKKDHGENVSSQASTANQKDAQVAMETDTNEEVGQKRNKGEEVQPSENLDEDDNNSIILEDDGDYGHFDENEIDEIENDILIEHLGLDTYDFGDELEDGTRIAVRESSEERELEEVRILEVDKYGKSDIAPRKIKIAPPLQTTQPTIEEGGNEIDPTKLAQLEDVTPENAMDTSTSHAPSVQAETSDAGTVQILNDPNQPGPSSAVFVEPKVNTPDVTINKDTEKVVALPKDEDAPSSSTDDVKIFDKDSVEDQAKAVTTGSGTEDSSEDSDEDSEKNANDDEKKEADKEVVKDGTEIIHVEDTSSSEDSSDSDDSSTTSDSTLGSYDTLDCVTGDELDEELKKAEAIEIEDPEGLLSERDIRRLARQWDEADSDTSSTTFVSSGASSLTSSEASSILEIPEHMMREYEERKKMEEEADRQRQAAEVARQRQLQQQRRNLAELEQRVIENDPRRQNLPPTEILQQLMRGLPGAASGVSAANCPPPASSQPNMPHVVGHPTPANPLGFFQNVQMSIVQPAQPLHQITGNTTPQKSEITAVRNDNVFVSPQGSIQHGIPNPGMVGRPSSSMNTRPNSVLGGGHHSAQLQQLQQPLIGGIGIANPQLPNTIPSTAGLPLQPGNIIPGSPAPFLMGFPNPNQGALSQGSPRVLPQQMGPPQQIPPSHQQPGPSRMLPPPVPTTPKPLAPGQIVHPLLAQRSMLPPNIAPISHLPPPVQQQIIQNYMMSHQASIADLPPDLQMRSLQTFQQQLMQVLNASPQNVAGAQPRVNEPLSASQILQNVAQFYNPFANMAQQAGPSKKRTPDGPPETPPSAKRPKKGRPPNTPQPPPQMMIGPGGIQRIMTPFGQPFPPNAIPGMPVLPEGHGGAGPFVASQPTMMTFVQNGASSVQELIAAAKNPNRSGVVNPPQMNPPLPPHLQRAAQQTPQPGPSTSRPPFNPMSVNMSPEQLQQMQKLQMIQQMMSDQNILTQQIQQQQLQQQQLQQVDAEARARAMAEQARQAEARIKEASQAQSVMAATQGILPPAMAGYVQMFEQAQRALLARTQPPPETSQPPSALLSSIVQTAPSVIQPVPSSATGFIPPLQLPATSAPLNPSMVNLMQPRPGIALPTTSANALLINSEVTSTSAAPLPPGTPHPITITSSLPIQTSVVTATSTFPSVNAMMGQPMQPPMPPPVTPLSLLQQDQPCSSTSVAPPPSDPTALNDRLYSWLADHPSTPPPVEDSMEKDLERRTANSSAEPPAQDEQIEAELLPSATLIRRQVPSEFLTPRYLKTRHDTTMAHIGQLIYLRVMEDIQTNQTSFDADPVPNIPRPEHFYVMNRDGGLHVCKIFLHESIKAAQSASSREKHLVIFFDIEAPLPRGERQSILEDIVPPNFLT